MLSSERKRYETHLARLERSEAWAHGRALSLEQAAETLSKISGRRSLGTTTAKAEHLQSVVCVGNESVNLWSTSAFASPVVSWYGVFDLKLFLALAGVSPGPALARSADMVSRGSKLVVESGSPGRSVGEHQGVHRLRHGGT